MTQPNDPLPSTVYVVVDHEGKFMSVCATRAAAVFWIENKFRELRLTMVRWLTIGWARADRGGLLPSQERWADFRILECCPLTAVSYDTFDGADVEADAP